MPKAPNTPLSCIFGLNKPTGQPSMTLLNKLQPLFASSSLFKDKDEQPAPQGKKRGGRRGRQERIKMGQGGTLDPLADGVLVIGTNKATKQLSQFLDCTKSYRAIALVGCSTDSYDSDGKIVHTTKWDPVTRESVEEKLSLFRGEIEQTPPVYSALKMDGKPLYEYARSNTPLPRPIPARKVTISDISLLSFTSGSERSDTYEFPKERLGDDERLEIERLEKMVKEGKTVVPSTEEVVKQEAEQKSVEGTKDAEQAGTSVNASEGKPPIFEISLTVSSGTYIRSVVHDLGIALGSSAHIVKLTRTRQGQFALEPATTTSHSKAATVQNEDAAKVNDDKVETETAETTPAVAVEKQLRGCVEWTLLEQAIARQDKIAKGSQEARDEADAERQRDGDGFLDWERQILSLCETVS